jgi:hypothetical protein
MLPGTFLANGSSYLYVNGQMLPLTGAVTTGVLNDDAVPEPASFALLAAPLALFWLRLRSRKD